MGSNPLGGAKTRNPLFSMDGGFFLYSCGFAGFLIVRRVGQIVHIKDKIMLFWALISHEISHGVMYKLCLVQYIITGMGLYWIYAQ